LRKTIQSAAGTVIDYLEHNPYANRYELLRGIAQGLAYIHDHDPLVVHGAVKPENILIDKLGNPRVINFGESNVFEDQSIWMKTRMGSRGMLRYTSPELLKGDQIAASKESDVYAYAMTCYTIFTGKQPFSNNRDSVVIYRVITRNERPNRPNRSEMGKEINDKLWSLMRICWDENIAVRPPMRRVSEELTSIIGLANEEEKSNLCTDDLNVKNEKLLLNVISRSPEARISPSTSRANQSVSITFTNNSEDMIVFAYTKDDLPNVGILQSGHHQDPITFRANTPYKFTIRRGQDSTLVSLTFEYDQDFDLSNYFK